MIGEAKFRYQTKDLIQLVKRDLTDKLGNRELAPYDMSVPGVIESKAQVTTYPNPKVTEKTVQEQINAFGLPTKPDIPRSSNSVMRDENLLGGDSVIPSFNRETNTLTLIGGPVLWTTAEQSGQQTAAHWVGVKIKFPLGWTPTQGQIIPYIQNDVPKYFIIDEQAIAQGAITLYFDACLTSYRLVLGWSQEFNPEVLDIKILASLEDTAIKKVPEFPTKSEFIFEFPPQEEFLEANICIDVDLSLGK